MEMELVFTPSAQTAASHYQAFFNNSIGIVVVAANRERDLFAGCAQPRQLPDRLLAGLTDLYQCISIACIGGIR